MKPGIKSSELYVTMIVVVLNAVLASGLLSDMPDALRITGAILAALSALGYATLRTSAKKEDSKNGNV